MVRCVDKVRLLFALGLLSCFAFSAKGQQDSLSNLRQHLWAWPDRPVILDTLPFFPQSVQLQTLEGEAISDSLWWVTGDTLYVRPVPFDSVVVSYRIAPRLFAKRHTHFDSNLLMRGAADEPMSWHFEPESQRFIEPPAGLRYSGSFSRGLSFGNSQNMVLNSSLNLQITGKLPNGVEVTAAMTDNNLPIQPEGNTQQLRDFDQVYIRLRKDATTLTAGDFELRQPAQSHFLNYFKRLQGVQVQHKRQDMNVRLSAAVARGRFARQTLQVQEGNQGPYRLRGTNGEQFVIVLAGTERVWLDGELLKRGADYDYVINYNRGDLTFTRNRLIKRESRVIVEFEYADQSYLRSTLVAEGQWQWKGVQFYAHFYNEQDGRRPLGSTGFDSLEQAMLYYAGNMTEQLFIEPAIDTIEGPLNEFGVWYKLVDTTVNGITYSNVLVWSTHPDSARYSATFVEVGPGQGDYVLMPSAANGRVYVWVAPDPVTGQPRGAWRPARRLIAPRQQQVWNAGMRWEGARKQRFFQLETALSRQDPNRLSPFGTPPTGLALFAAMGGHHSWDNGWQIEAGFNYEGVGADFQGVAPWRNAEFKRDWNLDQAAPALEHLVKATFRLAQANQIELGYELATLQRRDGYSGWRHRPVWQWRKGRRQLKVQLDQLVQYDAQGRAVFARPSMLMAWPLWRDSAQQGWMVHLRVLRERNARYAHSDTLVATSFWFDEAEASIQTPEQSKWNWMATLKRRRDYQPKEAQFQPLADAWESRIQATMLTGRWGNVAASMHWRQLHLYDSTALQAPTQSLLGRVNYQITAARGAVRAQTAYELGSGQERKIEFTYVRVPVGEGTHIWTDENDDGVVQQDEVEPAPFTDQANAIRVATWTNEFVRTRNLVFAQSLDLAPRAVWRDAEGWRKAMSRWAVHANLQIDRKVQPQQGVAAWNPFLTQLNDSSVISLQWRQQHTLFYNRGHTTFSAELGRSDVSGKSLLTNGLEGRRLLEDRLRMRYNLNRTVTIELQASAGNKQQTSEFFLSRTYDIRFRKIQLDLTYLPKRSLRFVWGGQAEQARNLLAAERLQRLSTSLACTWNKATALALRAEVRYVFLQFEGDATSSAGFTMLNGLQNGRNVLWNLTIDRQLPGNMRLSVRYEGRKTGVARLIHTGSVQMATVF